MNLLAPPTARIVTRRIGGLTAIRHPEVQLAVWSRRLAATLKEELAHVVARPLAVDFVTLTTDPIDRIQQQLRRVLVKSHQISFDIALLATVFGELSGASRVRVRLTSTLDLARDFAGRVGLALLCAYESKSARRRTRSSGQVAVFRPGSAALDDERFDSLGGEGIFLHIETMSK